MTRNDAADIAYDIGLYCWIVAMIAAYGFGLGRSTLLGAAGCLVLVLRIVSDAQFRKRAVLLPIDFLILAVWLTAAISLARSIYCWNTLESFIGTSTLISVYYVIRLSITSRLHHVRLWLVGAVLGLFLALATVVETVITHIIVASYHLGNASNLRTMFYVPVVGGSGTEKLSVLLALLPFPFLVAVEFLRKNWGVSVLGMVSAFMLLVSVALTLSRGMYLAVGIFFVVLITLLMCYSAIPRQRIVLAIALLIVSAAIAIIPWQRAVVTTALMSRTFMQVRSTQGRVDLWKMYLAASKMHPVLGVGGGNLGLLPVHLDDRDPAEGYVSASAFNTAIMLLVENGAVGLCSYLMLLAWFIVSALQYVRSGLEELDLLEMSLCLAAILSLCIRDLTTCTILTQPMTALLVCILAAMASRGIEGTDAHNLRITQ
jgi:O-antigen ligase